MSKGVRFVVPHGTPWSRILLSYPEIYGDAPHRLTVDMEHTRATNSFTLEFSSDRNGWVVRMDRTEDRGGWSEVVAESEEVAFIPAWNESP